MSLDADRDHYRHMAAVDHKPECGTWVRGRWRDHHIHPDPTCDGCNPQADRDLFTRLADEIDAYLAPTYNTDETTDLFGDPAVEPSPTVA